jgi:mycofactocin system glycosyltransferase
VSSKPNSSDPPGAAHPNGGHLTPALPEHFAIALDDGVRVLHEDVLLGGSPPRFLRLSSSGVAVMRELRRDGVRSTASGVLARRLTRAGIASPIPPSLRERPEVTVVVPVRDRADELDRALESLGSAFPVIVVDDASLDPDRVAAVCARHSARYEHLESNAGPGSARNHGADLATTEFLAFLDSDCVPPIDWIVSLSAHFEDSAVAVVAPRIVGTSGSSNSHSRSARWSCPLDMGERASEVSEGTRVPYVPSAALLVRRSALVGVEGFDVTFRYGEDVDLVWRLADAGWLIRYDPAIVVEHNEPERSGALMRRRFLYGTSAGPLALRHPGSLTPLVLQSGSLLTILALLSRRHAVGAAVLGVRVLLFARRVRALEVPLGDSAVLVGRSTIGAWLALSRWCAQFLLPGLLALLVAPGGSSTRDRNSRRLTVVLLLVGPGLARWWGRRSKIDPVRSVLANLADEAAYGAGVYLGSARARTFAPLLPRIKWRATP